MSFVAFVAPTRVRAAAALVSLLVLTACREQSEPLHHRSVGAQLALQQEPLQPLPAAPRQDPALIALGEKLFFEPRLSADGTVACSTCHVFSKGGQDGRRAPLGIRGLLGPTNTPSVFNSGFNFVQFWDGHALTLEDQMGAPLTNPNEMANDWKSVLAFLERDSQYAAAFRAAFPDGLTERNVRAAVASFERTLVTPNARFDSWLRGQKDALTDIERAGYERFKAVGCVACHQGSNVGGNMFQRFGVMGEYFQDRGHIVDADYGRFNVTHQEADRFVFRVPSLRNVELTSPYFHDGSAATLEQAVETMAKYQLGQALGPSDVAQIVAFLKTLTGNQPERETAFAERAAP